MVQYPIFLKDTDSCMYEISREDDLENELENIDVVENEYIGWDSNGRQLEIYLEENVIKVKLGSEEPHFDQLKQAISDYAKMSRGKILNPDEFTDAKKMFDVVEKE